MEFSMSKSNLVLTHWMPAYQWGTLQSLFGSQFPHQNTRSNESYCSNYQKRQEPRHKLGSSSSMPPYKEKSTSTRFTKQEIKLLKTDSYFSE